MSLSEIAWYEILSHNKLTKLPTNCHQRQHEIHYDTCNIESHENHTMQNSI